MILSEAPNLRLFFRFLPTMAVNTNLDPVFEGFRLSVYYFRTVYTNPDLCIQFLIQFLQDSHPVGTTSERCILILICAYYS